MRKSVVLSVATALLLLAGTPSISSSAQDAANDQTPTFYRLVPGTYVNGWPRFTVTYPKDWIEKRPMRQEAFRASAPGPVPFPSFMVSVISNPVPLEKMADALVTVWRMMSTDVTLVSDKPSQLRHGTPAREIEIRYLRGDAFLSQFSVTAKKGDLSILTGVGSGSEKIGEDLKAIPYSLQFQPAKDDPVKVPPDVQEFLDRWCSDHVAHDLGKVMSHYSDRYLYSGTRKAEWSGT